MKKVSVRFLSLGLLLAKTASLGAGFAILPKQQQQQLQRQQQPMLMTKSYSLGWFQEQIKSSRRHNSQRFLHHKSLQFLVGSRNERIALHLSLQNPSENYRTSSPVSNPPNKNPLVSTSAGVTSTFTPEEVASRNIVISFIDKLNTQFGTINPGSIASHQSIVDEYFDETIEIIDTSYSLPKLGKEALRNDLSSLFHVNGVYLSMAVKFVSISTDALCSEDIKVAVYYEYCNDNYGTISQSGNGITIYTVHKRKITQIFDVKDDGTFDIDSWRAEDMQKVKIPIKIQSEAFRRVIQEGPANTIHRFIDARNKNSLDEVLSTLSADSVLKSLGMDDWGGKYCESFAQSLQVLPSKATIQVEDIVAHSASTIGITYAACRWVIAIDGQRQKFSRGCSFFCIENSSITFMIDISESAKQEKFSAGLGSFKPSFVNFVRDSGLGRVIADSLVVMSFPSILKSYPSAIPTFAVLTYRRTHLQYGVHSSQFIDLFLPRDDAKRRGLIFFVHGGAWGSGAPWMYRLAAKPFLEANMAVAIVGYRTYPDGNIQDQVDDLEAASKEISLKYPNLCRPPTTCTALERKKWVGTSLVGHSSGAHVAMLKLVQRIECWSEGSGERKCNTKEPTLHFDKVIGISGVFSINEHFDLESGRGVEELSPMKPGCGYSMDSFDWHSPAVRLATTSSRRPKTLALPDVFFVHGMNDDVVPFSSAKRAAKILKGWGYYNIETHYLQSTGHQDTILHIMFGGSTRDLILQRILV